MFVNLVPNSRAEGYDEIRIDAHDTWSMDITLACIITPMLRQMKDRKHGVPPNLIPSDHHSNQYTFAFIDDDVRMEEVEQGARKWDELLDKMIWSFDMISTGKWGSAAAPEGYPGDYDAFYKEVQEGIGLFAEYYGSLWD